MNEKDAYRKLWSGEHAAEPYLHWLAKNDEGLGASEPFLVSIVDVMLSGNAENYELESPVGNIAKNDFYLSDELQLWLKATKQRLSTFKSEVKTRIIIFNGQSDITVRNLLGTKYNIEPHFFASIQHQAWLSGGRANGSMGAMGTLRWPGAFQAFDYATGTAVRHLKFENGFVACLLQDSTSALDGPKNIGTIRLSVGVGSKLTR